MSDQGFGSSGNPYIEDTLVEEIVEVGWGGPIVIVEVSAPLKLQPLDLDVPPYPLSYRAGTYAAGAAISNSDITSYWVWVPFRADGFDPDLFNSIGHVVTRKTLSITPVLLGVFTFTVGGALELPLTGWQAARAWVLDDRQSVFPEVWQIIADDDLDLFDIIWKTLWTNVLTGEGVTVFAHGDGGDLSPPTGPNWAFNQLENITIYQLAIRFPITQGPLFVNMKSGDNKTGSVKLIQPPVHPTGDRPFPDPGDFPATTFRAYGGGTWSVASDYSDVANSGSQLLWEFSVAPVAWSDSDQELGRFNRSGLIP